MIVIRLGQSKNLCDFWRISRQNSLSYTIILTYDNTKMDQATVQLWYRVTVAPAVGSTQMSGVHLNKWKSNGWVQLWHGTTIALQFCPTKIVPTELKYNLVNIVF